MKLTLVLIFCFVYKVSGHARLISPPSRASMWRFGFPTPADYNDNEGFCGGYAVSTFVTFSIKNIESTTRPKLFSYFINLNFHRYIFLELSICPKLNISQINSWNPYSVQNLKLHYHYVFLLFKRTDGPQVITKIKLKLLTLSIFYLASTIWNGR